MKNCLSIIHQNQCLDIHPDFHWENAKRKKSWKNSVEKNTQNEKEWKLGVKGNAKIVRIKKGDRSRLFSNENSGN